MAGIAFARPSSRAGSRPGTPQLELDLGSSDPTARMPSSVGPSTSAARAPLDGPKSVSSVTGAPKSVSVTAPTSAKVIPGPLGKAVIDAPSGSTTLSDIVAAITSLGAEVKSLVEANRRQGIQVLYRMTILPSLGD